MISKIEKLISGFIQAASLCGIDLKEGDVECEVLLAPHKPPTKLPANKMAVYIFIYNEQCFKVGKAGAKSQARYTSQHYGFNAPSTLAKSIVLDKKFIDEIVLEESQVAVWMRTSLSRVNLLLDQKYGADVLNFLEAFMQCALKPKYEGFKSQRGL